MSAVGQGGVWHDPKPKRTRPSRPLETKPLIVLIVCRVSLTIHFTVLRGRHVDARTAFGVGQLMACGIFRAGAPSRASERGLPARNRGVSQIDEHQLVPSGKVVLHGNLHPHWFRPTFTADSAGSHDVRVTTSSSPRRNYLVRGIDVIHWVFSRHHCRLYSPATDRGPQYTDLRQVQSVSASVGCVKLKRKLRQD
jgi:hypothetical protein